MVRPLVHKALVNFKLRCTTELYQKLTWETPQFILQSLTRKMLQVNTIG